ncbi:hypothetical protein E2C01_017491 [Portunus trituberculatus]|uniref:Uncharacterized protein n=1 Tax=Portunus trituberculatus TaxID=210409 RepID=A0A5B7DSL7_PORTR|nr:hypothetical protein [Portunus trituberculatus]
MQFKRPTARNIEERHKRHSEDINDVAISSAASLKCSTVVLADENYSLPNKNIIVCVDVVSMVHGKSERGTEVRRASSEGKLRGARKKAPATFHPSRYTMDHPPAQSRREVAN